VQEIKEAFRGVVLRDLRPLEDKDGVRLGEDVRISKETEKTKEGTASYFLLRFLKDTKESRKKFIRDTLNEKGIRYKEGKDYKD
jgi:hypothetical protein